jgi:hypothetical protein
MLSQRELDELIVENSKKEESMTPQQIKIRNLFHPRKVELIRMIEMFEKDLLELENRELLLMTATRITKT